MEHFFIVLICYGQGEFLSVQVIDAAENPQARLSAIHCAEITHSRLTGGALFRYALVREVQIDGDSISITELYCTV